MRKTLFVVGAGASREVNLPDGNALCGIIRRKLDIRFDPSRPMSGGQPVSGDPAVVQAMRSRERDIRLQVAAARTISEGLPLALSIDNFLENHRADQRIVDVGKLAIVQSILEAEAQSSLYFDARKGRSAFDDDALSKTWFFRFFKILSEHVRKDQLGQLFDQVAFITFNYDRCIEHFLFEAVRRAYAVSEVEARSAMAALNIIHPYGTVGRLPWQADTATVPFGGYEQVADLNALSGGIRIFTEEFEDKARLAEMDRALNAAETVVFLGFAYHPQNMRLLGSVGGGSSRRVFGTAFGVSDPDRNVIAKQIAQLFTGAKGHTIELKQLMCAALFDEYWRSLAVARV
jgi:hypothetical protein